jgi:hypothetical protein
MQRKRITMQRSGVIVNNLLPLLLCRSDVKPAPLLHLLRKQAQQ